MHRLFRFALVLVAGCSADTFVAADAGGDASSDAGSDAGSDATSDASDAQAPDAGTYECKNAGGCADKKPFCCGTFELGPGTLPACSLLTASTKCQADCPATVPMSCPSSGQVKICRDSNDCAGDSQSPQCCNIPAFGIAGSVCAGPFLAANFSLSCN